jgi:hypothetical protein
MIFPVALIAESNNRGFDHEWVERNTSTHSKKGYVNGVHLDLTAIKVDGYGNLSAAKRTEAVVKAVNEKLSNPTTPWTWQDGIWATAESAVTPTTCETPAWPFPTGKEPDAAPATKPAKPTKQEVDAEMRKHEAEDKGDDMMLNREMLFKAAADADFVRTEACCPSVGLKMCSGDVWKGNLAVFAGRVVAAQGERDQAKSIKVEAALTAACAIVREALDSVTVHPCDQHNDAVRAAQLSEPMLTLYVALRDAGAM